MKTLTVRESGTLLDCLSKALAGAKKKKIRQYLKFKSVSVNGRIITRSDHSVVHGDQISIQTKPVAAEQTPHRQRINVVCEDDDLILIEKPAGLLTISTEKVKTKTAFYEVNEYLKTTHPGRRERIYLVHRLDRETSGLLLFAKNEAAQKELQSHWEEVEKKYLAVVEGIPRKKADTVTSYLRENKFLKVYSTKKSDASKLAVTRYRVLQEGRNHSLVEILLETGRKNQIRVHLADIGHPVIGDEKYGAKTDPAGRMGLHAYSLSFHHPVTRKWMVYTSKLPPVLKNITSTDSR